MQTGSIGSKPFPFIYLLPTENKHPYTQLLLHLDYYIYIP